MGGSVDKTQAYTAAFLLPMTTVISGAAFTVALQSHAQIKSLEMALSVPSKQTQHQYIANLRDLRGLRAFVVVVGVITAAMAIFTTMKFLTDKDMQRKLQDLFQG